MKIIIAKNAGFCFGVNKAVESVYENLEQKSLYTYGEIVHNEQVTGELKTKGVEILESIDDLNKLNEGIVVIRAHGVPPETYEVLKHNKINYIDSTCPFVKKIHHRVEEYYNKCYEIIIVGDPKHPEVIGINGYAQNKAHILKEENDLENLESLKDKKVCVVCQTTFKKDKFEKYIDIIKQRIKDVIIFNTICDATEKRQEEAKAISAQADVVITVGGKNSSNTKKLYEIAKENCDRVYLIETVEELDIASLQESDNIVLLSGASTPGKSINDIVTELKKHFELD